jgi:ABC-type dipeptide/oligopeptide/nickel transport system ATPase component
MALNKNDKNFKEVFSTYSHPGDDELFIKATDHFKLVKNMEQRINKLEKSVMKPRLIALYGKAGSGKTTAANYLTEYHRFDRVAFADPIKAMLRTMLEYAGCDIDINDRDVKEKPCPELLGKSPRYALQTLGTEFGRECIGQDIWVSIAESEIQKAFEEGDSIVIDDLRFPNEAEMVKRLGGKVIWIFQGDLVCSDNPTHKSETQQIPCDHFILNDKTISELQTNLDDCLK